MESTSTLQRSFEECESVFKVTGNESLAGNQLADFEGSNKKLRGGYNTPIEIADVLATWVASDSPLTVLEPSAGEGAFIQALVPVLSGVGQITAVELSKSDAMVAKQRGGDRVDVFCGDFFSWYQANKPDGHFDAVIGNPPFIRYQDFSEDQRTVAFHLMREIGFTPNGLTNAWVPFVAIGMRALREGGLFAMVLPAELLQVNYAAELRQFLAQEFSELRIVTFRQIVFPGIQQETIVVLGVKGRKSSARISLAELGAASDFSLENLKSEAAHDIQLRHDSEKWLQYYLTPRELGLIREIEESSTFATLGDYAEVDVGVVTGRNKFFVLSESQVQRLKLDAWVIPLIGRSFQIPGLTICMAEWDQLVQDGHKCFLLQLGTQERDQLPPESLEYVRSGEDMGFHKGYKCRIRMPNWWNVPSVWVPDAFLLRQIHRSPRIIANSCGATCTDTIHRVRAKSYVSGEDLAAVSINSLTAAFAEIRGRSYGGGVLEIEPMEAEALPYPNPSAAIGLNELDLMVRSSGVCATIDEVDKRVLAPSGLADSDVRTLKEIWQRMSARRIQRKRRRDK